VEEDTEEKPFEQTEIRNNNDNDENNYCSSPNASL
jgi:hypothetical protein